MEQSVTDQMCSMDRLSLRQHWQSVAQLLRCDQCGSEQISLRAFGSEEAHWQCRRCQHCWKTTVHTGDAR